MGSDLRYNLINSFRSIDSWRANIIFNMMGTYVPGFKKREIVMGIRPGDTDLRTGEAQSSTHGSTASAIGSNSELIIRGHRIVPTQMKPTREQGSTAAATHLSIVGDGYFAVAESDSPGSRIFFTRSGNFNWKQTGSINVNGTQVPRYQLVNSQGLIVLRAQDIDFDYRTGATKLRTSTNPASDPIGMVLSKASPPGERDGYFKDASQNIPGIIKGVLGNHKQGDITGVDDSEIFNGANPNAYIYRDDNHDSDLAIVKLPAASRLMTSSYGGEIYDAPQAARQGIVLDSLRGWFGKEVGQAPHVLPMSLEMLDPRGMLSQLEIESETANFVYKNLSTFMQDYNKGIDDLMALIR